MAATRSRLLRCSRRTVSPAAGHEGDRSGSPGGGVERIGCTTRVFVLCLTTCKCWAGKGGLMAHPAISTEALSKSFGGHEALSGLDMEIQPGEIVGYLGPNGAGKTTTLRLLLGLVRPSAG